MKEYKIFRGLRELGVVPELEVYIEVFKRVYVGEYFSINRKVPIGCMVSIGQLAMMLSGDAAQETVINDVNTARLMAAPNTLDAHIRNVIFTAFPSYTPDDLDDWNRSKLLQVFGMAEQLLVARIGHEPIDLEQALIDPEQPQQSGSQQFAGPENIDFDKEADEMANKLGWDVYEAQKEEIEREKAKQKPVPKGLSRKQLAELDRIKASKRG